MLFQVNMEVFCVSLFVAVNFHNLGSSVNEKDAILSQENYSHSRFSIKGLTLLLPRS